MLLLTGCSLLSDFGTDFLDRADAGASGPDAGGDAHADGDADTDGDVDSDSDIDSDADSDGDSDGDGDCDPGCVGAQCGPGDWALVCAGSFTMGSPEEELGREDPPSIETQHRVTLTHTFQILSSEVTQIEFSELMGYNPSTFPDCGNLCPVEMVNWHEAAAYCVALSAELGYPPCYRCDGVAELVECTPAEEWATPQECPGYRLPTEAEWEYAARAGTTTATYNGDLDVGGDRCDSTVLDQIAWYCGTAEGQTHPAGLMEANAWGLYDMLGNVFEWCHDWYGDPSDEDALDPWGPVEGSSRSLRGGAWNYGAGYHRAAWRYPMAPEGRFSVQGVRVVRTLP